MLLCGSLVLGTAPYGMVYDEEEARRFSSLSSVTYCDDMTHVADWTCGACKQSKTALVPSKIVIVDSGAYNASRILVGKLRDQNGCLVAFRGSNNIFNWVRNFQGWDVHPKSYTECDGCKVHAGFYEIWENVRPSVLTALSTAGCAPVHSTTGYSNPDNLLYVTGHSLGAALTHLAMFSFQKAGFNVAKTYSFEAPRMGNEAFSKEFSERFTRKFPVFRVTHSYDPVVHLPPIALYQHVQTEVWYNKTGGYKICPQVEDTSCADQYWNVPELIIEHIDDHCNSPLVPNGDICSPECGQTSGLTIV
jgi:hypothetical protein